MDLHTAQCILRQRYNAAAIRREPSPAIRNQYGVYRWCVSTESGPSLPYNWLLRRSQVLGETAVVVLQRTKTILSIPGNCLDGMAVLNGERRYTVTVLYQREILYFVIWTYVYIVRFQTRVESPKLIKLIYWTATNIYYQQIFIIV